MNPFIAFMQKKSSALEKSLTRSIALLQRKDLKKAALYALQGGKRIRCFLMLAVVRSFCAAKEKKALAAAAALELVHTYSLIHDDLPCMDNDNFRRGKKSLHRAFPEWLALLTGDFLLTLAFEVIATCKELSKEERADLSACLAQRIGGKGMIAGQIADLSSEGKKISWLQLKKMQEQKSGFLFIAALEFGAILCHLSSLQKEKLVLFGKKVGFAYQIIDDLADASWAESSDLKKNKVTSVSLLGQDKAKKLVQKLLQEAEDLLSGWQKADLLRNFLTALKNF